MLWVLLVLLLCMSYLSHHRRITQHVLMRVKLVVGAAFVFDLIPAAAAE